MIGILSKSKVLGQGRSCKWIHVWSRWKDSNTYFQIFFHQRHLKPFSLFLFLFCESVFLRRNSNNNIKKNIHLSHWAPRTLTIKDSRQLLYPHNAPLPCPPRPPLGHYDMFLDPLSSLSVSHYNSKFLQIFFFFLPAVHYRVKCQPLCVHKCFVFVCVRG